MGRQTVGGASFFELPANFPWTALHGAGRRADHKEGSAGLAFNTINARAKTIRTKPAFKQPFERRRCLVPATGWYEWQDLGKRKKRPIHMCVKSVPFAFAGVWDVWKGCAGHPTSSPTDGALWVAPIEAWEVSADVGSPRNNRPDLLDRVELW